MGWEILTLMYRKTKNRRKVFRKEKVFLQVTEFRGRWPETLGIKGFAEIVCRKATNINVLQGVVN
ncbi:hypothetical protein LCGC14_2100200 [marine sediment metagenome]|uniref:Uncharacterized protein n=1 Tax=marine sediment metagenome TaxID=412755 RepID=A0A0F9H6M5_9ZZZZ